MTKGIGQRWLFGNVGSEELIQFTILQSLFTHRKKSPLPAQPIKILPYQVDCQMWHEVVVKSPWNPREQPTYEITNMIIMNDIEPMSNEEE